MLLRVCLLVLTGSLLTRATLHNFRRLGLPGAVPVPALYQTYPSAYTYNLPPTQQYVWIEGQPYAVLGETLRYVPAPYALNGVVPAVYQAAPAKIQTETSQAGEPALATSAADGKPEAAASVKDNTQAGNSASTGQTTSSAEPTAGKALGGSSDPPHTAATPDAATTTQKTALVVTASTDDIPVPSAPNAPAAPAAPAAPTATTPTVYLSSGSSLTAVPSPLRPAVDLSVSNPQVTVKRTESVYKYQLPAQVVKGPPVTITFNRADGMAPIRLTEGSSTPFRVELTSGPTLVHASGPSSQPSSYSQPPVASTYSQPSIATTTFSQSYAPSYTQQRPVVAVNTYSRPQVGGQPPSAADLIEYTLSQRPLLRLYVSPATQASYLIDGEGRRYDIPASQPAAPTATPSWTTSSILPWPYYGAAKGLGTDGQSLSSSASDNFKNEDMTALDRAYAPTAPTTYSGPPPAPASYASPLTISISTGKAANGQSGPLSPMSPGDFGPTRGDSANDNPAKLQTLT